MLHHLNHIFNHILLDHLTVATFETERIQFLGIIYKRGAGRKYAEEMSPFLLVDVTFEGRTSSLKKHLLDS